MVALIVKPMSEGDEEAGAGVGEKKVVEGFPAFGQPDIGDAGRRRRGTCRRAAFAGAFEPELAGGAEIERPAPNIHSLPPLSTPSSTMGPVAGFETLWRRNGRG